MSLWQWLCQQAFQAGKNAERRKRQKIVRAKARQSFRYGVIAGRRRRRR